MDRGHPFSHSLIRSQRLALSLALIAGIAATPATVAHAAAGGPLVIGVDHLDPANQQANAGRFFEYRDFFSREVRVHQGDAVDFRAAPDSFHVIGLAADEAAARAAYPLVANDTDDAPTPNRFPKIALGAGNFPVIGGTTHGGGIVDQTNPSGPPDCGAPGRPACVFLGGSAVEIAGPNPGQDSKGNPAAADWTVTVLAPSGDYRYFCTLHPRMHGTLHVVPTGVTATRQADIDAASRRQFVGDRREALAAERAANAVRFTPSAAPPGRRTYEVSVGMGTPSRNVGINEILPRRPLALAPGDAVAFSWPDPDNAHSAFFPNVGNDVPPVGFDCGSSYKPINGPPVPCLEPPEGPELVFDPGNAGIATLLRDPRATIDSGVLVGVGEGLRPSLQRWSVATDKATASGTYSFKCTIHDFMHGVLRVAPLAP